MKNESNYAMIDKVENNLEENVLPFLKTVPTKTDTPAPIGIDWLTPLTIGTLFLVKPKANTQQKIFLGEYRKTNQFEKAVTIHSNLGEPEQTVIVDPIEFCKAYELFEVTQTGEDQ